MAKKKEATSTKSEKLERHPLSEKYGPKMSDEELLGLGLDIKAHGQHEDIILFEGKVLAGWNRYMGCLQQGVKPKFKDKDKDADPVAVAFGTNFVRRRLSSVQKAFYGAQFCLDSSAKQADIAKLVGCNLNRLNQCCQLLKLDTDASKRVLETLRTNAEVTPGAFEEMLLECGITRTSSTPSPTRTNTHSDLDDDDGDFGGDDDLTGGAIDGLLGDDPEDEITAPRSKARPGIGDDTPPLPTVGSKPSSMKNPHETQVSRVAKAFKALSADEQKQFVKFTWGKLHPALNAAIGAGDVAFSAPEPKGKKGSAPPDPSLIARNKKIDADDVLEGKGKKKGAKKRVVVKKTPAKKVKAPAAKAKKVA
jgi:hypothetical protein